jgi:hypothetical protein
VLKSGNTNLKQLSFFEPGEPGCYLLRKISLALVNGTYGWEQFASQHILVKIGLGAQAQRSPDAIIIAYGCDYNELRLGSFRAESNQHFFPCENWQIPIYKRHVGLQTPKSLKGLLPVACFPDHSHILLSIHNSTDPLPHTGMVVNHQHADLLGIRKHNGA